MTALGFFSVCFPSLFSIVDPIACIPIYLALVGAEPPAVQRQIALRATMTVLVVLCLFATIGTTIFRFFGITVPAFRVAGGILLFSMALEMMRAKPSPVRATPEETTEAQFKSDVAIVPIGIPLLSGPGAIATAMVWSARVNHPSERLALFASILLVATLCFFTLLFAARLVRLLGKTGINVVSRIMGLILAATAAQFVLDGLKESLGLGAG